MAFAFGSGVRPFVAMRDLKETFMNQITRQAIANNVFVSWKFLQQFGKHLHLALQENVFIFGCLFFGLSLDY